MDESETVLEISSELRERILSHFESQRKTLEQMASQITSTRKFVLIPYLFDGIMDRIRYNVSEKRFDEIQVMIATGNVTSVRWSEPQPARIAYCDSIRVVSIPLP